MTDHKATPEQWAMLEERSAPEYDNTILELRARVEALEAMQETHHAALANATPEQIRAAAGLPERSSLVKRVALAISGIEDSSCWDEEAVNWSPEARAAIREVAAWLRVKSEGHFGSGLHWSQRLEQEAKQ